MTISVRCGVLLAALCVALPLAAADGVPKTDATSFADVYAAAQAAQKQSIAQSCAWNVTNDALAEAQALHQKGDDAGALKAAQHAQSMAEVSMQQCEEQKTLWKRAVVH